MELVKNGNIELDKLPPAEGIVLEKMPATALTIADEFGNVVTVTVDAAGRRHCVTTAISTDSIAELITTAAQLLQCIVFLATEEITE